MNDLYQSKIQNLDRALLKRAEVYPARDNSYVQMIEALDDFSSYLLATTDFSNFSPDPKILTEAEAFYDSPIFICGAMKSGTTLCTRLLDNHPDLLVMPHDSHYADFVDKWTRAQFPEIAAYWLRRLISPSGAKPFWFIGPDETAMRSFLKYLRYFLMHSQYEIFICVVMSVYAVNSASGAIGKKYWVEKTPHNELKSQMLGSRFPKAKFIHVLRDPLNNIAALKKLSEIRQWEITPKQHALTIKKLFETAGQNEEILGKERYHILTYEKLTANPRESLDGICALLDIPFHDSLLLPTENGRSTIANSMFVDSRVEGKILDQSGSKRYMEELSKNELREIVTLLYEDAIGFGYKWDSREIKSYRQTWLLRKILGLAQAGRQIYSKARHGK